MPFLSSHSALQTIPRALSVDSVWQDDKYTSAVSAHRIVDGRHACGNIECPTTRIAPWRNRKRPIFEGQWGCSGRCVLSLVKAAVQREIAEGLDSVVQQHHHRLPLGLLMLAQRWITHPQLQCALDLQKDKGGKIGEWLISECGVLPHHVTRGLSMQWGCPILSARGFMPESMVMIAPKVFFEEFNFIPVRLVDGRLLYLGFEDRLDASVSFALEQMFGIKVESGLIPTEEYQAAHRQLRVADPLPSRTERVSNANELAGRITSILEAKQPVFSKIVKMHQYLWLRLWLEGSKNKLPLLSSQNKENILDFVFTIDK